MKDVLAFRMYTRVARLGSFSAAAREAGLAQSQVSRMVADLEAELGVRLLMRTTRAVAPTEAGLDYLARIEPVVAAIDEAASAVREDGQLRGVLRVGLPSTLGLRVVIPSLAPFAEQHPLLRLELLLDDSHQDMLREAVDVGLRVGQLPEGSGTSMVIGKMQRVVVAAPSYLARAGKPKSPSELESHRIIRGPAGAQATSWKFERAVKSGAVESAAISLQPHVITNDTMGALAAAVAGLGITSTTSWACRAELEAGTLVRLLPTWKMAQLPVHAYFPLGRMTRRPARAFVDFLAAALRSSPRAA